MKHLETSPLAKPFRVPLNTRIPGVLILSLLLGQPAVQAVSSVERVLPASPAGFITLQARPDPGLVAWAVEEQLPEMVAAVEISDGGRYDPYTGRVKWGPYTDAVDRDLSYRVTTSLTGEVILAGRASWDGAAPVTTTGETTLLFASDGGFNDWLVAIFGDGILGTPEADPLYDGDDDGNPLLAEFYFGLDPTVQDSASFRLQRAPDGVGLTLVRRQTAGGLPTTLWFSSDMADWTMLNPGPPSQLSLSGESETIHYDFGDLGDPAFIRLQLGD